MKQYNKNLWPVTLTKCALIVLVGVSFYFGIEFYSKMEADSISKRTLITQKRLISLQEETFRSESNIIASLIFDDDLRKKMYQMENKPADYKKIHCDILEKYRPVYEKLSKYGLRHLQFYLPDGKLFLKVHNPGPCEHRAFSRSSIAVVAKSRKPLYGFEIGEETEAYRAIYPLFYNGKYIGSAELSFGFDVLKKALEDVSKKACTFVLAIDRNLLKKNIEKKFLSLYEPSFVDSAFMVRKKMSEELKILRETGYHTSLFPYREFFVIMKDESKNKTQYYITSFIPIKLIDGSSGGYYIIVHKDNGAIAQVMSIANIAYYALALLVFVSLSLTIMVHIYRFKAHAADIDPLTGIFNRRGCLKRLKNGESRYALLYIDIDHFKQINDEYGHETGDAVLREVAHIISSHIRKEDIFCRHGGEEFLLFLANVNEDQAAAVAEKLRRHIQIHRFEKVGNLTASVGVAIRERNESTESLIARADKNLYKAKNGGRNRVVSERAENQSKNGRSGGI